MLSLHDARQMLSGGKLQLIHCELLRESWEFVSFYSGLRKNMKNDAYIFLPPDAERPFNQIQRVLRSGSAEAGVGEDFLRTRVKFTRR